MVRSTPRTASRRARPGYPETFVAISGEVEAYVDGRWDRVGPGDVCHVPGDTRHGFRNLEQEPSVMIL